MTVSSDGAEPLLKADEKKDEAETEQLDCPNGIYYTLMGGLFLEYAGAFMATPLLPIISKELQATDVEIGYILGIFQFATAFSTVFWAVLSDYIPRKRIIQINLVGLAMGYVMAGCATTPTRLFYSRLFGGWFGGAGSVFVATIYDYSPVNFRARDLNNLYSMALIALTVSPALAGIALNFTGWRGVMFGAALFPLCNVVSVMFFLPTERPCANFEAAASIKTQKGSEDPVELYKQWVMGQSSIWVCLSGHFLVWMAISMAQASMILVNVSVFHYTPDDNLAILSLAAVAVILFCVNVNVVELIGPRKALALNCFLKLAVLPLTVLLKYDWEPIIMVIVFCVSNVFVATAYSDLLKMCPPQSYGVSIGVFQFLQMSAEALGPFVGGYCMTQNILGSYAVAWVMFGVCLAFIPRKEPGPLE